MTTNRLRDLPEITFIDTTLREGFQSAIKLFPEEVSPAAYAKAAMARLNTEYLEIYGPEIYYSSDNYELIVDVLGPRLQLYCGTIEKFEALSKPHINNLLHPRLSLTVIEKNPATIKKIQQVLDYYPSATLRLGLECAGSIDESTLAKFLQQLTVLERVDTITLSDSNGVMMPEAVRRLILSFEKPLAATLGFHLHNDRGLAAANALAAIEASVILGQQKISFDYTYNGLGERYGLLSLQEIAAFGKRIIKDDVVEIIAEIGRLFTDEARHFHSLPYMKDAVHVAASHFNDNGELRSEYRTSHNWSSNGQ